MKLFLDAGNSRVKWRCKNSQAVVASGWFGHEETADSLQKICAQNPKICQIFLSSVLGEESTTLITTANSTFSVSPVLPKVEKDFAALRCGYKDPSQLGLDRWLAILAGWSEISDAFIVVDAGSALTIDVVDTTGQHLGGLIAPGLPISTQALTKNAKQLDVPLGQHEIFLTDNTGSAIAAGCYWSAVALVEYAVNRFRPKYPEIQTILTGGDGKLLASSLEIDCIVRENLVLDGLELWAGVNR